MTEYSPSPSAPASDVREVNRENSILGNFSAPKGVGAAEEYIVNDALLDKAREASRDLGIPESVVQEDPGAARNIVEADRFNQLIRDDGDISQVFGSDPEGGAIMGRDESNVRDFSKAARDALDAHSSPFPEEYMETSAERHARLLQQSMWNQQPFWTRTVGHEAKRAYYNIKEGFHAFNQRVAFESAFKERSETELGLLRAKFHGAEDFNEDEYLENLRKELMVQGLDHRDSQTRTREVKDRILSSPRMNDFFKRSESREGARGWLSDTVDLFSTFYAYPDEFMAVSVNGNGVLRSRIALRGRRRLPCKIVGHGDPGEGQGGVLRIHARVLPGIVPGGVPGGRGGGPGASWPVPRGLQGGSPRVLLRSR